MYQQQGDVLIFPKSVPKGATIKAGRAILAFGEATGHCHEAIGDGVEMYEKDGALYLSAPHGAKVTHQEHHTQTLDPGTYQIGIVKEYDHFAEEARNVRD